MNAALGLALALATLSALAIGGGWPRRRATGGAGTLLDLPLGFAAGAVVIHGALAAATLAGRGWSGLVVLGALALGALGFRRSALYEAPVSTGLGAGAGVAAAAGALVVVLGSAGWLTQPDFYYHWALKARRFLEIGGADYYFLSGPSAWRLHPDYPLLASELLMLPSYWVGRWSERGALAMSALIFALVLLALRRALAAAGLVRAPLELATAVGALLFSSFALGFGLVGAADPLLALALLLALPALLDEGAPRAAHGWAVGLAAALAAAAKIEGVPLAALLIAVELVRRLPRGRRLPPLTHVARLILPTSLMVLPWYALACVYRLFLETNAGAWRWERAPEILAATLQVVLHPDWALAPALLLALPFAFTQRRLAAAATVVALQLALYYAIYFTGPVDTRLYVVWSLPRLLFHLLPATFVLVAGRFFAPAPATLPAGTPPPECAR